MKLEKMKPVWVKVVFAAECSAESEDGENLMCPNCNEDYATCECPGPTQDDIYDYEERADGLYARRRLDDDE